LGFLGSWPFAANTPNYERWISLDFLGFSRPNRDLSMSYKDFSRETILAPFSAAEARERAPGALGIQTAQDCSSRKLSFISDFLQLFAIRSASFSARPCSDSRQPAEPEGVVVG
jgi:hypothetical protein